MDVSDYVRLINALLASLVFCALCYKGRLYFKVYDTQQKLLYTSFTCYALATAYGSVEAFNQGLPAGFRLYIFLVANVIAIFAFARYSGSAFKDPDHPSGSSAG